MEKKAACIALCVFFMLISCKSSEDSIAVIWTNSTEFISYAEAFNNAQSEHKIVISYKKNPADALLHEEELPDIVIAPWLKGDKTRGKFANLNSLLSDDKLKPESFYTSLLELGNTDNKQFLLPVCFNLPAIIFSAAEKNLVLNNFTLSLEEMSVLSQKYNKKEGAEYVRMGFSPRWDMNFLYAAMQGFGAGFEETEQSFSWDTGNLEQLIDLTRNWSKTVNTSTESEDTFKFKYLYDPPHKLITNNRCLFWYLPSDKFFSLPAEQLEALDYRWMSCGGKTPLHDTIIYAGLCKKAKNKAAAKAFFLWFFTTATQQALLERGHTQNMITPSFGLAGGFSSIRDVTETVFPVYYKLLLKRLPQMNTFLSPNILPNNWEQIKKEIIFPFMEEETKTGEKNEESVSLEKRIALWNKKRLN